MNSERFTKSQCHCCGIRSGQQQRGGQTNRSVSNQRREQPAGPEEVTRRGHGPSRSLTLSPPRGARCQRAWQYRWQERQRCVAGSRGNSPLVHCRQMLVDGGGIGKLAAINVTVGCASINHNDFDGFEFLGQNAAECLSNMPFFVTKRISSCPTAICCCREDGDVKIQ